jgi:hypothetical protein
MENAAIKPNALPGRRGVRWGCWTTILVMVALLAGCIVTCEIPETMPITEVRSPDGKWDAVARDEDYGLTIFDTWDFTVSLRPATGWFRAMRATKVLDIPDDSRKGNPLLTMRWSDAQTLVIEAEAESDFAVQRRDHAEGVRVIYIWHAMPLPQETGPRPESNP